MKNKVVTGGVIALTILVLIAFLCFKLGEKFFDITPQPEQANTNIIVEPPRNLPPNSPEQAAQVYLALGNPSNATNDAANRDNYLMVNKAYALSYNSARGTANWVSWRISESDFGATDRQNNFRPDPNLPPGFTRVTPADYAGSGFDRGHLSPSADRSNSEEANSLTFLMTNMIPQTGDLNRNAWEELETYSRNLVKRGKVDLYVVAGVYGERGKLKKKIAIPTNCWKILVAVPQGAGVSAVNENTHVIAVDMPNRTGIAGDDWRKYRTTARSIEQKTGYNFLS
ncbi:MAG TPA: DNA/RNA non-specific endonuclease, partial [Pyrinomonadaceae bacterium]|nr:DNA/RNA non-specific endonuclease [Pyrinomonadaceae bacterium]